MRRLLLVLGLFVAALPRGVDAQRNCKKGIPCGNSCIAANKTCRIGTVSRPDTATKPTPLAATSTTSAQAWVASSSGRTYYRADCSGASKLAKANRVYFKTEADAKAAGLTRSVQRGC